MPMVYVLEVRVFVRHGHMRMQMLVRSVQGFARLVSMLMVLIVDMRVTMFDCRVPMVMLVAFRQMQPNPQSHQACS